MLMYIEIHRRTAILPKLFEKRKSLEKVTFLRLAPWFILGTARGTDKHMHIINVYFPVVFVLH